ncbi:MAG: hypothetical protein IIW82_02140, partial [Clostridia bacterium]|nr:hypothetical protein [Clostridia bacterium]
PPTETQPKPEEDVTDPPPTETQPKPEEDVADPPPTETQPKPEEDVTDPPPTETQPKPEEDVTDPPPTETQPKPEEEVTAPPPTETQPKSEEDVTEPPPTETQPKPEEDLTVPQLPEIIPGYGPITYLTVTNQDVGGKAFLGSGLSSGGSQSGPPRFGFRHGYIHVLARAVEEYPEIYESLNDYGSAKTARYRLFRMEVIDPLDSGLEGDFYYVLPAHLKGDLTKYDALLISMEQLVKNYVLRHGDQLTAFEYLFADPGDHPELGNMIAFTDGIFDESLWQDKSWNYGYQFGRDYLDVEYRDKLIGGKDMLVERGSTLEEALRRRQEQADKWNGWPQNTQVQQVVFPKEEAKAAMEYVKPFVNGVFAPVRSKGYYYRRYINGCPTNEWIGINDGTVSTSEYRFEAEELEGLPDLSAYIAKLDLSKLQPPDADRGDIAFENVTVVGSYEKSADGVRAVVEIAWRQYIPEIGKWVDADDTLISLDENGTVLFCREDLKELFGVH